MSQQTGSMPALDDHHEGGHPSLKKYVWIAIFLAIITAVEVAIYYIESLEAVLVPTLIVLSVVKFAVVVGYFMHLKFDSRLLTFVFGSALVVSLAVYVAVWVMMYSGSVSVFYGGQ
jgi:cytochrome c oxidase subunit 4